MKALILAAGDLQAHGRLLAFDADIVICADGGLRHAASLGIAPDLLVGDLDSVSPAERAAWPDIPVEKHPTLKGSTDLELATAAAISRGATSLLLAGTTGSRRDQELAALMHAVALRLHDMSVHLDDGVTRAWPLIPGDALRPDLASGATFSIVALSAGCTVSITGAAWELDRASLDFGSGLGVSNLAVGEVGPDVRLHAGLAVLMAAGT